MPIIKEKPGVPPAPKPSLVIAKPGYLNIAVDNAYHPKETLLAFVEGAPWTTDTYYSQVLGLDSGVSGQGLGTDATLQSYKAIHGMEIRVTSPLTNPTQDNVTKELGSTGAATIYPPLIPNVGDMFTAGLLDGRVGVFEVTGSTRLSIFRDTCHSIEYTLIDFGASSARINDLKRKVIQDTYFEKDFIFHGQNPILVGEDYENLQFLRRNYSLLITQYFKKFTSKEYGTIVLPDQAEPTYDGFLVNGFAQHLNTWNAKEIVNIRKLNTEDDPAMSTDSLWTILITRNREMFEDSFKRAGITSTSYFTYNPVYEGIRYSGLKKVIYPLDPSFQVDEQLQDEGKPASIFIPTRKPPRLSSLIDSSLANDRLIGIKNAFEDGYYIFSKAFYENSREENAQSALELCIQDYIDSKDIDYGRIRHLVEASTKWDNVNSFYFTPMLIILIKAVIRAI